MCALYALLNHFMTEYAFVIDGSPNMYILRQRTSIFLVPKWCPASQTIVWFTFNFSLLSKDTFTIAKGNKYTTVQTHGPPMKDSRNPTRQLRKQKRTKLLSKQKLKERKKRFQTGMLHWMTIPQWHQTSSTPTAPWLESHSKYLSDLLSPWPEELVEKVMYLDSWKTMATNTTLHF